MQIPALFKNPMKTIRKFRAKKQKEPVQFTQQELQQLSAMLREGISEGQKELSNVKEFSGKLWQHCDKNNPDTAYIFNDFSRSNKDAKHIAAWLRKMEAIQTKVKRMLRA